MSRDVKDEKGQVEFQPLATVLDRLNQAPRPYGNVDGSAVQDALGLRSLYLAERLLYALGGARGFEAPAEFVAAANEMMAASINGKLEFLFRLHDADRDARITPGEIERMLHIAAAENNLHLSDAEIDELIAAIMKAGDIDRDGRIDLVEFIRMMVALPEMAQRFSDYGVALLMPGKRARERTRLPSSSWSGWVRNEMVLAVWLGSYVAINVLLFGWAFLRYREAGANLYIQIARGAGACLNFNGALIVVPMLRHTLTWIRRSSLGGLVPVDDAVSLHSLVGEVTVAFGVLHSVAHVLNINAMRLDPASTVNLTGFSLIGVMLVMWIFSRGFVRRSGRFELFHLTHLGYFAVVVLLFAHGPSFWLWGTAPWLWYLGERVLRLSRRGAQVRVLSAQPLASGVTRLDLQRPPKFEYAPCDYVFLRVPSVARHEWHPFTLTSAPEDSARISVHVRSVGNWTQALRAEVPRMLEEASQVMAHVDGPYGTSSHHILDAPHAVAIAGGIGVTPFASVLQSLLLRQQDPHAPPIALRKLRFVWLNRDQHSFEWFRDLLAELERRDSRGLLDIHTFMTGGRADMAGGLLDLAQHLIGRQQRGDLVTGLRAHTHMGAPDFDRLLESFYRSPNLPHPEVFFCGPTSLERVVARSCHRLGLRFRHERF